MEAGINHSLEHRLKPLAEIAPGRRVVIRSFRGGRGMRQRLLDLGIVPGEEVKVVRGGRGLPHVLMVKTSKIMLGHGIAKHIMVSETEGDA